MYTGIINVGGVQYYERPQNFPLWMANVASLGIYNSQRVALPSTWMFRLKALARDVLVYSGGSSLSGTGTRASRPFLFRLGGASDSTWYTGGAVATNTTGVTTDYVLDTNFFGTGQFPYPLVPDILYPGGSQISFEVQDVSNNGPYDIHFAFIGAYLIPINSSGAMVSSNS